MSETTAQQQEMLEYRTRQKRRNIITGLLLGGMVVLFFLATLVRLGENVGVDRFSGS